MKNIKWLSKAFVLAMHQRQLQVHGGLSGKCNDHLIESTLSRPIQLKSYGDPPPSLFELAASYGFGFAKNHCFNDGNKRVSLMGMYTFLKINGYHLKAKEAGAVLMIESLAAGKIGEVELSVWVKQNSIKLRPENR